MSDNALAQFDPPCWLCDWTEEGYDVDPQTNCKDTCDRYEDYRLLMLAKGIEVVS